MKQQQLLEEVGSRVDLVCEAWNQHAPMKHSVFTKRIKGAVHIAIEEYGSAEIIVNAIKKYGEVCSDPKKYWWTMNGFLLEGFLIKALPRFVDTPLDGFKRTKEVQQKINSASNLLPKI